MTTHRRGGARVADHDHRHVAVDCRYHGARGQGFDHLGVAVVDATLFGDAGVRHPQHDRAVLIVSPVFEWQDGPTVPPQKGVVVPFGPAVSASRRPGGQVDGGVQIRHVEQGDLGAGGPPLVGGLLADAQDPVRSHGVEVAGVAGDLQLAAHLWIRGVRQVDGVEGVGLAERDHVGHVAHISHGEDPLAATHVAHLPDHFQRAIASG